MSEEQFIKALEKAKITEKKVNFDQTVDLIINLKNFDVRKEAFNIFIPLPEKIKNKKIAGFLEKDSKLIYTIKKDNFPSYKEKKDAKKLVKSYDFFIANAKLMPAVATTFGRVLGPVGKMPSPQLGVIMSEDDKTIESLINKINSNVRIRVKEPSIKIGIGKESIGDEKLASNAFAAYSKILQTLPKQKDNIRNVKIKLTMGKPVNVEI